MTIIPCLHGEIDRTIEKNQHFASGFATIGFSSHADHASRHLTLRALRSPTARIVERYAIPMTIITSWEVTS
jgi:hypothetical protein